MSFVGDSRLKLGEQYDGARMKPMRVAIVAASFRWIGGQGIQADLLVRHWLNDPEVNVRFIPIDPIMPVWVRWVEHIPVLRTFVRAPFYFTAL